MRKLLIIIFVCAYLAILAQVQNQTLKANFFSISGQPLENVYVTCSNGARAHTDLNGCISITGKFERGREYNFTVSKAGFNQITIKGRVNDNFVLGDFWLCPDIMNCNQLGILIIKEMEEDVNMYLNGIGNGIIIDRPQHFISINRSDLNSTFVITFVATGYCQDTKKIKITGSNVIKLKLKKKCKINIVNNNFNISNSERRKVIRFFEMSKKEKTKYIDFLSRYTEILNMENVKHSLIVYNIIQGVWYDYTKQTTEASNSYEVAYDSLSNGISQQELDLLQSYINDTENRLCEWLSKKLNMECN